MSDILDLRALIGLAKETVSDPTAGAEAVLKMALPRDALWLAFSLMIVGSMFLGELVSLVLGGPDSGALSGQSTVVMGLLQGVLLFIGVHAITRIGHIFGGTGSFDGALALVTWLQFIFLLLQVAQLALAVIAPPLAAILSLLAIVLFFWLLSHFIAVLHGFPSVGSVFVMTLASFVGIVLTLYLVLSFLGLGLPTEPPT